MCLSFKSDHLIAVTFNSFLFYTLFQFPVVAFLQIFIIYCHTCRLTNIVLTTTCYTEYHKSAYYGTTNPCRTQLNHTSHITIYTVLEVSYSLSSTCKIHHGRQTFFFIDEAVTRIHLSLRHQSHLK